MSAASGLAFVDTNVLVYAFSRNASAKRTAAKKLLHTLMDSDRLRLSTQVLQELFVTLTRKGAPPCAPSEVVGYVDDLAAWPIFSVDVEAIREAARLTTDAPISFWDALIVVAAVRSGATSLYTEDLNHGQRLMGVEIVNPFV